MDDQDPTRTDELTGLPNRRWAEEQLPGLVPSGPAAAIVEVDHLELLTTDHRELVLCTVASLVEAIVGPGEGEEGLLARLGGAEFLVVRPGAELAELRERLEDLRAAVATLDWSAVASGLTSTISAGAVTARADDAPTDLLRRLDEVLYVAKVAGRNRVMAY